jgi:hypothetical protein
MLKTLNKKYPFNNNLKINVRSIVFVSLGIFLFLLFFQPFNIQNPDFNNRLIILATFGAISLVLLSIFRLVIPSIFTTAFSEKHWNIKNEIIINLLFVIFNSVAFSFFAKYVGRTPANFHTVIIIVIISISSTVIIVVTNRMYLLKMQVILLSRNSSGINKKQIPKKNIEIEFESEIKSEYFKLFPEQIILIKSANNYIEVIYKKEDKVAKRLIRNTLKNTENLFEKYSNMVRCHRSCIVNRNYIQKVTKGSDGLILTMYDYEQQIHVSRQYVLKVKEALKNT